MRARSNPLAVSCLVFIDPEGAVLATRRNEGSVMGGLWEFPGGKLEPGESAEAALRREILEELQLPLGQLYPLTPVEHTYTFGAIRLLPFLHRAARPDTLSLIAHSEYRWVTSRSWKSLDWAPADIPVLNQLTDSPHALRK